MEKTAKNTPKKGLYMDEIIQESLNSRSYNRVLNEIFARLQLQKKTFLITPNPEFLIFASSNPSPLQPWHRFPLFFLPPAPVCYPENRGSG